MSAEKPEEQFIKQYQREVWLFARLLGASPDLADDLTQEVFIAALKSKWQRVAVDERARWVDDVTDEGWTKLISSLAPGLEELEVWDCAGFSDAVMRATGEHADDPRHSVKQLKRLKLTGQKKVSVEGLNAWAPLFQAGVMERLDLRALGTSYDRLPRLPTLWPKNPVTGEFFDELYERLPNTELILPSGEIYHPQFVRADYQPEDDYLWMYSRGHSPSTALVDKQGKVVRMCRVENTILATVRQSAYGLAPGDYRMVFVPWECTPLEREFTIEEGKGVTLTLPSEDELTYEDSNERTSEDGDPDARVKRRFILRSPRKDEAGPIEASALHEALVIVQAKESGIVLVHLTPVWDEEHGAVFSLDWPAKAMVRELKLTAYVEGRMVTSHEFTLDSNEVVETKMIVEEYDKGKRSTKAVEVIPEVFIDLPSAPATPPVERR